jgi:hypothetical protein
VATRQASIPGPDLSRHGARCAFFQRVSRMWQRFPFLLWVAVMFPGIDPAPSARAQDPAKPAREAPRTFQRAFVATDLVSITVEGEMVAGTDITRERLERRLAWEIKRLDQSYGLTAEQKKKLEIAGRGDIKRLFERIRAREETLRRARENSTRSDDLAELALAIRQTPGLTTDIPQKLFVEGSIFSKTLKKTFRSEQREKYEKAQRDFYRSRVEWAVASGVEVLRLSDDQSRRLVARIVEETRPLGRYGPYDFQAVMIQASRLPENTLKPIFDDRQWRRLLAGFEEVKRFEDAIVAGGYLPEEADRPAGNAAGGLGAADVHGSLPE